MDPKDTWPVVKFLIAATGFKRRDARSLLGEIPRECHADLFLRARRWDRDSSARAGEELTAILGGRNLATLAEATKRAMMASHIQEQEFGGDDSEDEKPRRRKRSQK
jgi:hypothetical protein